MAVKNQTILLKTPEKLEFLIASFTGDRITLDSAEGFIEKPCTVLWSNDAGYCAYFLPGNNTVSICDARQQKQAELEIPHVHMVAFSPSGRYLITLQKPSKELGGAEKNLKGRSNLLPQSDSSLEATMSKVAKFFGSDLQLWEWRTREVHLQLFQKTFSRDAWPLLQLTTDESYALHQVNNAVNAYKLDGSASGVARKLALKNVGGFAVSPKADSPVLAAFVPEAKGIPGYIGLWNLVELDNSPNSPSPFSRRSFFRANSAKLFWNSPGTALLALTASDTDASNQSYYGEQKLYFLTADGSIDCSVPLPKEGPVHDVQWAPQGSLFVTVSGFMPAKISLFSSRCKLLQDLGAGPHNMVRWNPQGRFLAVAGFGNLPGDIALFEKQDGRDSCNPLGAAKAEDGVSLEWSPDGRHIMVATTAPRMRVNNGIHIFRYTGQALEEKKLAVLLEAKWQPAAAGDFEDRASSPRKPGPAGAGKPSTAPIRSAGYVPPHARQSTGKAPPSGQFSLAREHDTGSSKLGMKARSRVAVPGSDPDPDPDLIGTKKPKKRGGGKSGKNPGDAIGSGSRQSQNPESAQDPSDGVSALSMREADKTVDPEKRIRNLTKKLTQIQQLREKLKAGDKLTPEQIVKIEAEQTIDIELKLLKGQGE